MLDVLAFGTGILLGPEKDIEGLIVGVTLREGCHPSYECVWYDGRQRRSAWCWSFEVTPKQEDHKTIKIGF